MSQKDEAQWWLRTVLEKLADQRPELVSGLLLKVTDRVQLGLQIGADWLVVEASTLVEAIGLLQTSIDERLEQAEQKREAAYEAMQAQRRAETDLRRLLQLSLYDFRSARPEAKVTAEVEPELDAVRAAVRDVGKAFASSDDALWSSL